MLFNRHETVTTTELVRNLSALVDQVRLTGRQLFITKGNQTVAQLSPPPKTGYPISQLDAYFASLPKLNEDSHHALEDLKKIRKQATLPENPWG